MESKVRQNPFEFEAASKFSEEQLLDLYIEDFNFSRFLKSKRNVFFLGERGTGKSMAFLFNALKTQHYKATRDKSPQDYSIVCIYIPCNTPLTHRQEHNLLDDKFRSSVISEHFLVVQIMFAVAEALSKIPDITAGIEERGLIEDIKFALDLDLPPEKPLFDSLMLALQRQTNKAERCISAAAIDAFYEEAGSFSSWVLPFLRLLGKIPKLSGSHFSLMLDDAHDLNPTQNRLLNSWIAYRDNSLFSFKVATSKIGRPPRFTSSGGTILEGHDFLVVDMEHPYQNTASPFGKLARDIIQKRLRNIGIDKSPEDFFPTNPDFIRDVEKCKEEAREEAEKKYGSNEKKKIDDYVYKYARAKYFRNRSPRANMPPYSGFETLVNLSTGVVRNLLEPCYRMYDLVRSDQESKNKAQGALVSQIPHGIQTQIIGAMSLKKWEWIQSGLDTAIEGCSTEQAKQLYRMFDKLALHFRERLEKHKSEPRAIKFTVSEQSFSEIESLNALLKIAQTAQILYTYFGSSKDDGGKLTYYVPNRILLPSRFLDPVGQHATVSIRASALWQAASKGTTIPMQDEEQDDLDPEQQDMLKSE